MNILYNPEKRPQHCDFSVSRVERTSSSTLCVCVYRQQRKVYSESLFEHLTIFDLVREVSGCWAWLWGAVTEV